ncbi:MAG: ABC transporter permease [Ruminiclostridium sp.]|nr:ABC transporter permease [Ruminiclostridium sp.]
MQVFNAFMKVMKKKIFIAFIYIFVFVFVAIAMTFTDNNVSQFEQVSLKVCVFDEDDSPESHALCSFIGNDNELVTLENDRDVIMDALYYERADYVLTINNGYAEKLASGDTDGVFVSMKMHDSYSTVYMGQMLNEYVSTVSAFLAGGNDVMDAVSRAEEVLSKEAEVNIASFVSRSDPDVNTNTVFFFRFLPYIILGAVMSTLCPVLLVLGRKDIRYRTNCSGIHQSTYTIQIFAASAVYIIGIWLVFMIVGLIINGGTYSGIAWLAVLNSFVFSLFAAMLTIFVVEFEPPATMVNIITQVVSLGMCFLCGVFVEQPLLGDGVLAVARFLPTYWYIRVNRMIEGSETFDMNTVVLALSIEFGCAAVMALLAALVRKSKYTGKSAVPV